MKKKRLIIILCALVILIMCISVNVFAERSVFVENSTSKDVYIDSVEDVADLNLYRAEYKNKEVIAVKQQKITLTEGENHFTFEDVVLGVDKVKFFCFDSELRPYLDSFEADISIEPVISVSSTSAMSGGTAEVSVKVKNNPGIFGAILNFSFDSNLTLIDAKSGEAFTNLYMTKPGKFTSPCNFVWDGMDIPAAEDGEILKLTFKVSETAKLGDIFAVSCGYPDGGIINSEFEDISLRIENGCIKIGDPCDGAHTPSAAIIENEQAGTCKTAASYDEVVYCSICGTELSRTTKTGDYGSHEFYNGKCKYCDAEQPINSPTIIVNGVNAAAGDAVDVFVTVKNNPGILGAILSISYDPKLILTAAEKGKAFSTLDMTKPGKFVSPCNFVWDGMDTPATEDGEILKLTFKVSDDAKSGDNLEIKCGYSDGGIINSKFESIDIDIINAGVNVK